MSEGYKVTEVGDIPETWEAVRLKEVGEIITGNTPPTSQRQYYDEGTEGYLWASPADLGKGKFIKSTIKTLTKAGFEQTRSIPEQAILVTCIGSTIGKIGMSEFQMSSNQQINSLVCKDKSDPNYYYYVLESKASFIKSLAGTHAVPLLNKTEFSNILVPLPPLAEQQKIASILSTVDEKIAIIDAQISQTQELKKGLMQQLLSKGIGHTKFKSSELGDIPESWEVVKLSKIIKSLSSGVSVNSEDRMIGDNEYGVLKTSAVLRGRFYPQYHKAIIPADINRATLNPKKDTILISRMNTPSLVGESGYVYEDFKRLFIPDRIWMAQISSHDEVNVRWLSFVLASPKLRGMISLIATGTSNSMKNIAKPAFLGLKIALPPKEDQVKIGSILSAVEEKLCSLQSRKETYQQLKKGLMQQLLTGKIRVNTSHNEPALA